MNDHSLTRQTATGLAWSWGSVAATTLLQLMYTAVMSRLLEPSDFGLMAATLVGLRFVTYFSRFGLASAVIQRVELTREDESTAFQLAMAIGVVSGLAALLISPVLAAVVDEPATRDVMRWMSISIFLGAVAAIPEALLRRRFRFRALAVIQVTSFVVGYLLVGLNTANRGWGVWSLVAANLSQIATATLLGLLLAKPSVGGRVSRRAARSMLGFGGAVTMTGFLEFLAASLDALAIGRWVGGAALGQYSRATMLAGLPVEQATAATSRVLLPGLSRVQSDSERYSAAVVTAMGLLSALVMVPIAMVSAGAPAVVPWILGPGWDEAAAVLPIVGIAYGFGLLTNTPAVAAEARGAVARKLGVQLLTLATTSTLFALAVLAGPSLTRFAAAWAGGEVARHLYYWIWLFGHLQLDRRSIVRRYSASTVIAAAGAAPVLLVVRTLDTTGFWPMVGSALIGLLCAAGAVASSVGAVLRSDAASVRERMRT